MTSTDEYEPLDISTFPDPYANTRRVLTEKYGAMFADAFIKQLRKRTAHLVKKMSDEFYGGANDSD